MPRTPLHVPFHSGKKAECDPRGLEDQWDSLCLPLTGTHGKLAPYDTKPHQDPYLGDCREKCHQQRPASNMAKPLHSQPSGGPGPMAGQVGVGPWPPPFPLGKGRPRPPQAAGAAGQLGTHSCFQALSSESDHMRIYNPSWGLGSINLNALAPEMQVPQREAGSNSSFKIRVSCSTDLRPQTNLRQLSVPFHCCRGGGGTRRPRQGSWRWFGGNWKSSRPSLTSSSSHDTQTPGLDYKDTLQTACRVGHGGTRMPLIPAFEAETETRAQGSLMSPSQPGLHGETLWTQSGLRKRVFLPQMHAKPQTGSCRSKLQRPSQTGLLQSAITERAGK